MRIADRYRRIYLKILIDKHIWPIVNVLQIMVSLTGSVYGLFKILTGIRGLRGLSELRIWGSRDIMMWHPNSAAISIQTMIALPRSTLIDDREASADPAIAIFSQSRTVQVLSVIEHAHFAHLDLSHALFCLILRIVSCGQGRYHS
jgi:hypothetical protein